MALLVQKLSKTVKSISPHDQGNRNNPRPGERRGWRLFGLAKTRLKPEEFAKVAGAVPGMDSLLAAAPAVAGTAGSAAAGAIATATGGASALGGLAPVAPAFEKLGLKPEMAMKAVPVLANYVTKSGSAEVASLLLGALK